MRKSSATGALAASSVVISPFAFVIERGGITRLLSRLSNMSAPDDRRWIGRLRRLGGSFARSTGSLIAGWLCWAIAIDPTSKSNKARKDSFNIETLTILLDITTPGKNCSAVSTPRLCPNDAQSSFSLWKATAKSTKWLPLERSRRYDNPCRSPRVSAGAIARHKSWSMRSHKTQRQRPRQFSGRVADQRRAVDVLLELGREPRLSCRPRSQSTLFPFRFGWPSPT